MFAETLVDDTVNMLKQRLPRELRIEAWVTSEQQIQHLQSYPTVFVLCPEYSIGQWYPDYADVTYNLVIGVIHLEQDPSELRRKLYQLTEEFIKALLRSQEMGFPYTLTKTGTFTVNFSPIFTQVPEQFTADAQVLVQVQRSIAETI